jgi:hypothetical protein
MSTMFDDYEPEDAWDRTDDPADQLENLRRRVRLLYVMHLLPLPPIDTLALVALAVVVARARDDLTARDTTRIADLFDDIAFLAGRL